MGRKSVLDSLNTYQMTAVNKVKNEIISLFGQLDSQFEKLKSFKSKTDILELNESISINQIFDLYTSYHYSDDLLPGETNLVAGCININHQNALKLTLSINETKKLIKSEVQKIYKIIDKNALPIPLRNEIQDEVYQHYLKAKNIEPRINWKMVYRQIPLPFSFKLPVSEVLIAKHDMVTSKKVSKNDLKAILKKRLNYHQGGKDLNFTTHDLKVIDDLSENISMVMRYNFSTFRAYIYQNKDYKLTPMTMPLIISQTNLPKISIKLEADKRSKVRTDKIQYADPILQSLPVFIQ